MARKETKTRVLYMRCSVCLALAVARWDSRSTSTQRNREDSASLNLLRRVMLLLLQDGKLGKGKRMHLCYRRIQCR